MSKGFTVISETYKSCQFCEYLDSTMIRSGRHPLYHHKCQHPQWKDEYADSRVIGERDRTPSWCPLIPKTSAPNNDSEARSAVSRRASRSRMNEPTISKGQLISDLAEFINAKIDANEGLYRPSEEEVTRTGLRAMRAAEKLAQSLEKFVDDRIEQKVREAFRSVDLGRAK